MSVNLWNTVGVPAISNAILGASQKYNVPYVVLAGVMGAETDYGRLVDTSSANAQGAFQFIPSTASSYGYPLTDNPNATQLVQQANAAAHLLSTSHHSSNGGNWSDAILAYNPGGGQSYVNDVGTHMKSIPGQLASALKSGYQTQQVGGNTINIPNPISSVSDAVTGVFNQGVKDLKYAAVLVVVLFAAGFLLIHGVSGDAKATALGVAKAVPK